MLIVDRDGVINEDSDAFIKSPEEWVPIPGSLEAIARANHAGYRIVVASNQSGLARGLFDIDTLNNIHAKMLRQVADYGGTVEAIFFCPHGPEDGCRCRKPEPGMYEEISERLRLPLTNVPVVGDKTADIEAARRAGARPVLVLTGKGKQTLAADEDLEGVSVFPDLAAFVDDLLAEP